MSDLLKNRLESIISTKRELIKKQQTLEELPREIEILKHRIKELDVGALTAFKEDKRTDYVHEFTHDGMVFYAVWSVENGVIALKLVAK